LPSIDHAAARGEIAVIERTRGWQTDAIPVSESQPSGLALGPGRQLCVGSSKSAVTAGFRASTLLIDLASGAQQRIWEVGGSDEVWFDAGTSRYYVAAAGMPGGPVLGVIDALTCGWVENVPTGPAASPL
jgi:hypothetical protein